ncbi:MAG: oligosaccharide flippase family protein [Gracilimonas sp.]
MLNKYSTFIQGIRKSLYAQQVARLVSGTTLAHLVTILVSPVLTRLFPAEAFGELQLFHSLVVILSILSSGCFEYTFVLPKNDKDALIIFKVSFLINILFCALFYISTFLFFSHFSNSYEITKVFIWLLPAGVFFNTGLNIMTHWLIRFQKYSSISTSKIFQSTTTAATQGGLGFINIISSGLVIGHVLGRVVSTFYLFLKRTKTNHSRSYLKQNFKTVVKKYFNTTKFLIPSNLLSFGAIEIPVFIIGGLFDQEILGFYALAYRVLSMPASFIGNSVGQVFFKQLSDKVNERKTIQSFIIKTWITLFVITIIPTTILLLFSEPLFVFVFGDEWLMAGTIAMVMTPLLALDFISAPTGKTLIVLEKQKMMPVFSCYNLIVRAGGLLIGWMSGDFIFGLTLLVIGHSLGLFIYNAYLLFAVRKYQQSILPQPE